MASSKKRKHEDKASMADGVDAKRPKKEKSIEPQVNWLDYELLAEKEKIDVNLAKELCNLFDSSNTIPFLCRYRRNLIDDLSPERLRHIQETLASIRELQAKVVNFMKREKGIEDYVKGIKSFEELGFYKSHFKFEGKRSLYERAVQLGLEPAAQQILSSSFKASKFITNDVKTREEVRKGVQDILIHLIVKNKAIIEKIRRLNAKYAFTIETKKASTAKDVKDNHKFENYFNFSCDSNVIKSHQILAIFRGESLKVLKVSFSIHERFSKRLFKFASNLLLKSESPKSSKRFKAAFDEAFKKRISPFLKRQFRNELQKSAHKAAIGTFGDNLKNLLLTCPLKGKKILGIDPGFKHGCKMAMINERGDFIDSYVIFPFRYEDWSKDKIIQILKTHDCDMIALGNGTGCRETEIFLQKVIKEMKNVKYSIVNEQAASIYSCSEVAKKEFPDLDAKIISAISIARRLMDPLSELVKIKPKHLGVGMYQHDVNEKSLNSTLESVVSECVSFVGVDVNCASESLLRYVAGLGEKRAKKIIDYRTINGPFTSRAELMKVGSIGPKTFTQIAGFLRVIKETAKYDKINLLDSTNIHPESYELTEKILNENGLRIEDFGSTSFSSKIKRFSQTCSTRELSEKFKVTPWKFESVLATLRTETLLHDIRNELNLRPFFKQSTTSIESLKIGQIVSGVVRNIVYFGAFIDIGAQRDGLMHYNKFRGIKLKVGDRVELRIEEIAEEGKKIRLDFIKIL